MNNDKQLNVVDIPDLSWPSSLKLPTKRFRLLIAADSLVTPAASIVAFAASALNAGMVYCCAWGKGCERFHDIVDECVSEDSLGARRFAGPSENDLVMTTWHDDESLEEALHFFVYCAVPTDGFAEDSDFHLVICVGHPAWSATAKAYLNG